MRVDINIDSGRDPSVTTATPAEAVTTADAGPASADTVGAIDAGPPSPTLLAEVAAAGGDGALSSLTWPPPFDGRHAEALDAGSAPS